MLRFARFFSALTLAVVVSNALDSVMISAKADPIFVLPGAVAPVSLSLISGGILSPSGNLQDDNIISETSDYKNAILLAGGSFIPLATDDDGESANLVTNPEFTYGYSFQGVRFLPYGPGGWALTSSGNDVLSYGAITVLLPTPVGVPTVASQGLYTTAGTKYFVDLQLYQADGTYGLSLGDISYGILPVVQQPGGPSLTEDYLVEFTATSGMTEFSFTAQVSPSASLGQSVSDTGYAGTVFDSLTVLAEGPSDPAPTDLVAVPEPSTLAILGGLLTIAGLGQRIQARRA